MVPGTLSSAPRGPTWCQAADPQLWPALCPGPRAAWRQPGQLTPRVPSCTYGVNRGLAEISCGVMEWWSWGFEDERRIRGSLEGSARRLGWVLRSGEWPMCCSPVVPSLAWPFHVCGCDLMVLHLREGTAFLLKVFLPYPHFSTLFSLPTTSHWGSQERPGQRHSSRLPEASSRCLPFQRCQKEGEKGVSGLRK